APPAALRDYGIGAQILVDLGLKSIRILTNNPKKIVGMEGYGLEVTDQIPIEQVPGDHNREYLRAKRDKLGHTLHHQGLPLDEDLFRAERGRYAGVACLGAVIRGETDHYDWVCSAAAHGIELVQIRTGVPCAFGVLTVENLDQALARAGGDKRDQGYNAALVVVRMSR